MRIIVKQNENGSFTAKAGGKQRTWAADPTAHGALTGTDAQVVGFRTAANEVAKVHGRSLFPHTETVEVDKGVATFVLG